MLGLGAAPTNNNNNYGGFGSNSSNNIRITINRIQVRGLVYICCVYCL